MMSDGRGYVHRLTTSRHSADGPDGLFFFPRGRIGPRRPQPRDGAARGGVGTTTAGRELAAAHGRRRPLLRGASTSAPVDGSPTSSYEAPRPTASSPRDEAEAEQAGHLGACAAVGGAARHADVLHLHHLTPLYEAARASRRACRSSATCTGPSC
jgi:hypothetical protein